RGDCCGAFKPPCRWASDAFAVLTCEEAGRLSAAPCSTSQVRAEPESEPASTPRAQYDLPGLASLCPTQHFSLTDFLWC
ncbi:hypothetical protein, partial [Salmonella enterica]|uniref:hypothetical protein n=1 Tax=Salmonella enterica TaxID=28901 RepID=UPI0020A4A4EE